MRPLASRCSFRHAPLLTKLYGPAVIGYAVAVSLPFSLFFYLYILIFVVWRDVTKGG